MAAIAAKRWCLHSALQHTGTTKYRSWKKPSLYFITHGQFLSVVGCYASACGSMQQFRLRASKIAGDHFP
ncbi:hypothetical protein [Methylobacterium sp. J-077]|uniref:hypothetical protein n=1 Tax=Methylobacterium sp. J-077 TaxID=2836656 RepID=UPI001FB95386|nr:hypothetical protein [Methylobacterium sp. J-077]MCJ2125922.1 hypothetical protein [Methylobacterium sp. J-077]